MRIISSLYLHQWLIGKQRIQKRLFILDNPLTIKKSKTHYLATMKFQFDRNCFAPASDKSDHPISKIYELWTTIRAVAF